MLGSGGPLRSMVRVDEDVCPKRCRRYAPHLASQNRKTGPQPVGRGLLGYKLGAAEQTSGTRYRAQEEGTLRCKSTPWVLLRASRLDPSAVYSPSVASNGRAGCARDARLRSAPSTRSINSRFECTPSLR